MCYTRENKLTNLYTVNYVCDLKNDFTLGHYINAFHHSSVKEHLRFKCYVERCH